MPEATCPQYWVAARNSSNSEQISFDTMPTKRQPHRGSLQYRPRKRATRLHPKVSASKVTEVGLVGFAGYKVGMTHLLVKDNRKKSMHKQPIGVSATIVECPPLKVIGVKAYALTEKGELQPLISVVTTGSKDLKKVISPSKKNHSIDMLEKKEGIVDVRLEIQTQPALAGFGKKRPEIFEIAIGGKTVEEKITYAKEVFGKDVAVKDILKEGQFVDVHAITKGKGIQGPVRRFGVSLRSHKSEKTIRGPGSLGPWTGNRSWTVAHAGQTGLHKRTERNKWLIKVSDNPEDINAIGGFLRYGFVKSSYILLKGSLPGASKRLLRFSTAALPSNKHTTEKPVIASLKKRSHQ